MVAHSHTAIDAIAHPVPRRRTRRASRRRTRGGILWIAVSGILLAVPITGTVLPCFTLQRYGAAATASLMTGFLQGLHGFTAFFLALYWTLGAMHPALAFCLALAAAIATASAVEAARRWSGKVSAQIGS